MRTVQRCIFSAALLLAVALPSGCSKKSTTSPQVQQLITNNPGDFTYQGMNVQAKTGVETYAWQSNGDSASVNQTSNVSAGFMTLTIQDAVGTQVYFHSLTDQGTFPTIVGNAGTWTIRIDYAHASGRVTFRVQKV
jgi:hypothetical protein